jgi:MtrB/PioB family decaheme-associated outer membrane protein
MRAKQLMGSFFLLVPALVMAEEAGKLETTGELSVEFRKVDLDPNSAKFNEYSDVRNGFPRYGLGMEVLDTGAGRFLDLRGSNLLRDDQQLRLRLGEYGSWRLSVERQETPHNLSFKAMTPFRNQGGGLYTVDSPVPIPNRSLTPTAAQLLENDAATAAWLPGALRPIALGTQRDRTGFGLSLTPTEHLKIRVAFTDEQKDGNKISYGAIGDRPPRTTNAQLAQPIDFSTQELKLEAEYNRPLYQVMASYAVSRFENEIDTFRWQNIYADDTGSGSFDQWAGSRVATFGQYPLAPDNSYQNATLSLGVNMPWGSRLTVSAAYGRMEQNQTLLPYASSSFDGTTTDFSSTGALPRATADAEISTKRLNVEYNVSPISRLNLRAYLRYYDLDNKTPVDKWWYVTSDTVGGGAAATVTNPTYKNQRRNMPYSYTQGITGIEATQYFSLWRTSLALGFEREDMDRSNRESSDSFENTMKATVRARPAPWLSLRGKALIGERDGGVYNNDITKSSYWYDPTGRDNDNPLVSFSNLPDMRKYDVSDRERQEFEASAVVTPTEALSVTLSLRDRRDDFDSGVTATQPLLENPYAATDADRLASTPGDQLGLLKSSSRRFALDAAYVVSERMTFNAFASRETIKFTQRGLEFNENNKLNPTLAALVTSELGSWTRASGQWVSVTEDKTSSFGFGANFAIVPNKVRMTSSVAYSKGTVNIEYSGFGTQSAVNPANVLPDEHQFAFRTPPAVQSRQSTVNLGLQYRISKSIEVGLQYAYDRYRLSDWMQEANTPWFESVGSEHLLRDTSSATSNQWGNRLVNLGSYLAPSYRAHSGSVSLSYRF